MVTSGVGGRVIVTEKVPSTSSASGPPAKVTIVSPSTVSTEPSQPSTGSAIGSATPSGKRMSSRTVGEPSQPCSTVKPTVSRDPAWPSAGSGSMCADATPAEARSTADAAAAKRTRRRIMAPQGYGRWLRFVRSAGSVDCADAHADPTRRFRLRHRRRRALRRRIDVGRLDRSPAASGADRVGDGRGHRAVRSGSHLGAGRRRRTTGSDERGRRRVPAGHARPPRPGAVDLQSVPRRPTAGRRGAVRPRGHHVPDSRHRLDGGLARRGGLLPWRP